MTSKNLSPLSLIEESLYQKVKNVPFKVWHYVAALALLTVIPSVVASLLLPSDAMMWVLFGIVAVAWITSRVIGRNLSRNKGIDSVLLVHILGIVVHHYKSKRMIKNIKKDELFQ